LIYIFTLGLVEVIELPGVVITEYELVVLSGECTWLLPYEEHFPTLAHVQNMSNFNHIVRYSNLKLLMYMVVSLITLFCMVSYRIKMKKHLVYTSTIIHRGY
jgi:hypothetical protein